MRLCRALCSKGPLGHVGFAATGGTICRSVCLGTAGSTSVEPQFSLVAAFIHAPSTPPHTFIAPREIRDEDKSDKKAKDKMHRKYRAHSATRGMG